MRIVKVLFFAVTVIAIHSCNCSKKVPAATHEISKKEITDMMLQQAKDWSNGNIEAFMHGYQKSDSLRFIGSRGITYGWQQTLDNYKKGYPDKEHTGTLTFDLLDFDRLAENVYLVIGKYHLERSIGNADGIFSVILKKIDGEWKIIADHSSS